MKRTLVIIALLLGITISSIAAKNDPLPLKGKKFTWYVTTSAFMTPTYRNVNPPGEPPVYVWMLDYEIDFSGYIDQTYNLQFWYEYVVGGHYHSSDIWYMNIPAGRSRFRNTDVDIYERDEFPIYTSDVPYSAVHVIAFAPFMD